MTGVTSARAPSRGRTVAPGRAPGRCVPVGTRIGIKFGDTLLVGMWLAFGILKETDS